MCKGRGEEESSCSRHSIVITWNLLELHSTEAKKMTRKGLLGLLPSFGHHHHRRRHDHRSSSSASSEQSHQGKVLDTLMADHVAAAEAIVVKWDPDASAYAKVSFLFHGDRAEAIAFLTAVHNLQRSMLCFVSGRNADSPSAPTASSHSTLVRAQTLMQAAMRRLEKEFYQILSANRDFLDPESISGRSSSHSSGASDDGEEDKGGGGAGNSTGEVERAAAMAMADLRAIAETMIASGYGKECVNIYKVLRKSVIDEGLYRRGFERLGPAQINKLDFGVLETKIRSWLAASRVVVPTLFSSERTLMDHAFGGFDSVREAIFAEIAGDSAVQFLRFPELVAKSKRSTEKMKRILDLYDSISEMLPEIESLFSFESTSAVRDQAIGSLSKLAETARTTLADFETAVHKEHSKSQVPGGGIHPLTLHVMDYIAVLADYERTLTEIFADFPFQSPSHIHDLFVDTSHTAARLSPAVSSLSSISSLSSNDEGHRSSIAMQMARLILVLLRKLDAKAEAYRDPGLSYLFLMNNLQLIVSKVRACRLRGLLGEDWIARHAAKARQHAAGYERLAWGKVAAAVPVGEVAPGEARERMCAFSALVEEACTAQIGWVVTDSGMREEVRAAVQEMVLTAYRNFYMQSVVPEDVSERLAGLFGSPDHAAPPS